MPLYEYRCRECDAVFERRRTMAEADLGVDCPEGHLDVKRLLPVFSAARSTGASPTAAATPPVRGCGAACACH